VAGLLNPLLVVNEPPFAPECGSGCSGSPKARTPKVRRASECEVHFPIRKGANADGVPSPPSGVNSGLIDGDLDDLSGMLTSGQGYADAGAAGDGTGVSI